MRNIENDNHLNPANEFEKTENYYMIFSYCFFLGLKSDRLENILYSKTFQELGDHDTPLLPCLFLYLNRYKPLTLHFVSILP